MILGSNELANYLSEIAIKSRNGEIPWTQPNPSTFKWTKQSSDGSYQVTIQKALKRARRYRESSASAALNLGGFNSRDNYLFQVRSSRKGDTLVSLASDERPEFENILQEIFESAEKGIDIQSTNVLKKLLSE